MLQIGEVAKKMAITTVAIRHYEKLGLIRSNRGINDYRLYDEHAVARLKFIENAKKVGLTLSQIKSLLDLEGQPTSFRVKNTIEKKRLEIKAKIKALQEIYYVLDAWDKACDGAMPTSQCPILAQLYQDNQKDTGDSNAQ
ncbi:MerR family transcriptional regulator [Facilibium subflavum]|uniref:MerR family transcriptional regulator n=1 Tax=Facilibium subflavum TaxID=2219058 RepID=UPI0013C2E37A|nr:MerR family transcriptional regulator [Facilibium subflavum]